MDLISTITITDIVAGASFSMLFGIVATAIAMNIQVFWQAWSSSPLVQTVVNTTLVVLESTEMVWQPVVSTALIVLKPIIAFALAILKPFGPLALILADNVVRALVLFGFMTAHLVVTVSSAISSFIHFVESAGVNVTMGLTAVATGLKDFSYSLYTIVKGLSYVLLQFTSTLSLIIGSFEHMGSFLHRTLFQGHRVTWEELSELAVPFTVVSVILGIVAWRVMRRDAKPEAPHKKTDMEECVPRRSSRIARKRAMLLCSDVPFRSSFASEKTSTSTANL